MTRSLKHICIKIQVLLDIKRTFKENTHAVLALKSFEDRHWHRKLC